MEVMSSTSPPSSMGGSYSTAQGTDNLATSSISLDQLKALQEKKVTKDGKPPKKRGPKPDTKPALTRRQELNRQAQRTHRERKETYIKALEDEVLRLKQVYTGSTQDKKKLADENRILRALLQQHGITPPETSGDHDGSSHGGGGGGGGRTSNVGQFAPAPSQAQNTTTYQSSERSINTNTTQQMDYEQAGIDFVLT
ncbi:uncharacterized protein B0I36DRAFT_88323 [Microdochium trichocladiopsis]|uniref:BZIP domain-containing protein n=1 Tax=Microdochium trichocladiopsis TaxID=1682393 RepID=A0A9P8YDV3_9PEZI|nr:uncharacterized protein B0I36DRAFT_88323 [Microdochium trichocladiopsis]KAH7035112.1 hypothetical protein B0I36DRAFT_88323 [Microdochium trichocladiopsis]